MADNTRKIFISDLHLCTWESLQPPSPWGWMSEAGANRLVSFLEWVAGAEATCDELVLLGDVVDLWVYPHTVAPPSLRDVLGARQNQGVVRALGALRGKGVKVTYIRGNHDMGVDEPIVDEVLPQDGPYCPYPGLRAEHGHALGLFNAPDPRFARPAGYYLSRMSATYQLERGMPFPSVGALICENPRELLRLPEEGVVNAALDAVRDKVRVYADVSIDQFTINEPPLVETYMKVSLDFQSHNPNVGVATGVLSEMNPYEGLEIAPGEVVICGHSHDRAFKAEYENTALYINTGAWCGSKAHFASVWRGENAQGQDLLLGRLSLWEGRETVCNEATVTR